MKDSNQNSPVAPDDLMAAPFWRLLLTIIYDTLIVFCVLFVAWQPVPLLDNLQMSQILNLTIRYFYAFLVTFIFFGWFWVHGGQTIGMRAWKIKLLDQRSAVDSLITITWKQALIRYFVALLSWAIFAAGFIWLLFDSRQRSWHDMASSTRLVKVKKKTG